MTVISFYKIKMINEDIKSRNYVFSLIPTIKRPVYKYHNQYYIAPFTNTILYLIDFGTAFIKDLIEPNIRIEKDRCRIFNDINWDNNLSKIMIFRSP